jgi:hypothetical protein
MSEFHEVKPLKILEKSTRKGLGRGNLGALVARAGVGKTACLIHLALEKLFRHEKLVHISLEDNPEKVISYYRVILNDLMRILDLEDEYEIRALVERNRMILGYMNRSFQIERLRANLKNLTDRIQFAPDTLIVDGLDFVKTERTVFESFRGLAVEFQVEIWFSALSHRHIPEVNERGIPFPCSRLDDFFSIIIQLEASQAGIFLNLLKDHESGAIKDVSVKLDPNTFLATA